MSRTDKTKPLWVRCAEHEHRAVHDHRRGPCDLPPRPPRKDTGTRCRWEYTWFGTSCCSGPNGRAAKKEWGEMNRARNRRDRYAARRAARRAALRAARSADREDID
ncbi:hypothetical protein K378_02022 [Streptomyces sp. Amel2xB2]|uniref:hypothetical protein n=1 Tax=Streptomyces sp. Amel2xB2 TaxID=1305829 RepID=UPI000DB934CD|nr:hypothetical protein [Streptomyces sp. Amel2xB2]RAJ69132.1 hypothetical protein K378_02022 [Streptomyces sp. Amel2xB2]